jgi:serine/threonine protein phosphatase 1
VRPGISLDDQRKRICAGSARSFSQGYDFGAIVVHGHSISKVVEIKDNRIGIDTGAYCYDTLTAICLE